MKPSNVANWLKSHSHRVMKHLDMPLIKKLIWQLTERKRYLESQERMKDAN